MSDIVERLRAPAYWISGSSEGHEGDNSAPLEAADEITTLRAEVEKLAKLRTIELEHSNRWLEERDTLRAEVERLRAALKKIAKVTYGSDWTWGSEELADYYSMRFFNAQETARAALGEGKK